MTFLKSLINRFFSSHWSPESRQPEDHFEQLSSLQQHHEWIDVKRCSSDKHYQSLILQIDAENRELVIDELYPPEQLDNLQAGETFEISSQARQPHISFFSRLLAVEQSEAGVSYRLELPEEIGINQNRSSYRVYVGNEFGLGIDITLNNEPINAVQIINLSMDGIKLSFPQDMTQHLEQQRTLNDCVIHLPTGFKINCNIELRNLYRIRTPHLHTLAGGRLLPDNPQQRVKLQQYLAAVQRRQRRIQSREH